MTGLDHPRPQEAKTSTPEALTPEVIRKLKAAIREAKIADMEISNMMEVPCNGIKHILVRYSTAEALVENWEANNGASN